MDKILGNALGNDGIAKIAGAKAGEVVEGAVKNVMGGDKKKEQKGGAGGLNLGNLVGGGGKDNKGGFDVKDALSLVSGDKKEHLQTHLYLPENTLQTLRSHRNRRTDRPADMDKIAGMLGEKVGDMVEDAVKSALGVKDKGKDKDKKKGGISSLFGGDKKKKEEKEKGGFFSKIFDKDNDGKTEKKSGFSGLFNEQEGAGAAGGTEGETVGGGEGSGGFEVVGGGEGSGGFEVVGGGEGSGGFEVVGGGEGSGGFEAVGVTDRVWTGRTTTQTLLSEKGQQQTVPAQEAEVFWSAGTLLRTFYDSVVASAIFYLG
ncbi:hypothetical protein L3Q82_012141 [Scortum barcoo]|uniref:Uncharacterized protein n=1 Tax=Scortum barcoo TaxID=214431 RepID=A0ACB8W728_9TELE|nr:hypothetical protein L3Q82_012141 [Scortum barcoo]